MLNAYDLVPFVGGNGIDLNGPEPLPLKHLVRLPESKLDLMADGALDYVLYRTAPQEVKRAWGKLKIGGRMVFWLPMEAAVNTVKLIGEAGWNWIEHQEDGKTFLQAFEKRDDLERCEKFWQRPPKSIGVVRHAGYGDLLTVASTFPHLAREGYAVTVYTEEPWADVLRNDPNVARIITGSLGMVGITELPKFWAHEAEKHDRFLNFSHSVEATLLHREDQVSATWSTQARHRVSTANYLELAHDIAEVPHQFRQGFYATDDEKQAAAEIRHGMKRVVVIADTGTGCNKWWPYAGDLALAIVTARADVTVFVFGTVRTRYPEHDRITVIGKDWSFRQAAAFAQAADVVIGQETGLLNAVAMWGNTKIVLLSHSTPENLTKHWVNAIPLAAQGVSCYPCHILHQSWAYCDQDVETKAARCQAEISRDEVMACVLEQLAIRDQFHGIAAAA